MEFLRPTNLVKPLATDASNLLATSLDAISS